MPVYVFSAIDPLSNSISEGKLEAENLRIAKEMLREQGQIPTKLEVDTQPLSLEQMAEQIPFLGELFTARVSLNEVNILTQQLSTLIDAGIPLIEALYVLEQQTVNKRLKHILKSVRADVIAGDSFSASLARFPNEFSKLYINMIRAGEVSGELDHICQRLSGLLEKYIALQKKIQGAMAYPAFTLLIIVGVVCIILFFVVPQFQSIFANFKAQLPLPTQALIVASKFVQNFWWGILIGVGSVAFWFNTFRKGQGKPLVDQWMLTFPLIGDLMKKVYVSRFVRTLATVLGAGVPLTEGIVTAAGTVDNYVLQTVFEAAKDSILSGGSLARPLEQTQMFPLMVTKMIAIGEETGRLESMLNKSADFLDIEVDTAVHTMTTLIEPIMIVFLGGILLMVALALYLPMFDIGNVMTGNH